MTDADDGETREYGPEDFGQHSVEVEIHVPPEAWEEACERFHAAQEKGYDAELHDFVNDLVDIQYDWKIASDASAEPRVEPREDGEEWEDAGRALFNWMYAQVRNDVTTSLDHLSWKVDQGEPISGSDVKHLRRALEDAEFLAEKAAAICPETDPFPDWTEGRE